MTSAGTFAQLVMMASTPLLAGQGRQRSRVRPFRHHQVGINRRQDAAFDLDVFPSVIGQQHFKLRHGFSPRNRTAQTARQVIRAAEPLC